MPWSIIALPVIIALIWGFKSGVKMQASNRFKRPFKM
jgi:hypothetical protein